MPNKPPTLIATRDVATRIGRDVSTVHRLVDAGQLNPTAKAPGLRGAYLFTEDEIARYESERDAAESVPA